MSQLLTTESQNLNISTFSMMQPPFLLNIAVCIIDKFLAVFCVYLQIYFVKAAKKYINTGILGLVVAQ